MPCQSEAGVLDGILGGERFSVLNLIFFAKLFLLPLLPMLNNPIDFISVIIICQLKQKCEKLYA